MSEQSKSLQQLQQERSDAQEWYFRAMQSGLPVQALLRLSDDVITAQDAARMAEQEQWNAVHPDNPIEIGTGKGLL